MKTIGFLSFLIILFILNFFRTKKRLSTKISYFLPSFFYLIKQRFNPDINTDNWDLHKLRLEKYRRSQYKSLTFFISSEDRIYYLSENGSRVYC